MTSWLSWVAGIGGQDLASRKKPRDPLARLTALLRHEGTDLVLDVGANRGQYATMLRRHGYDGRIVSFEPLPEPHDELSRLARADQAWRVVAPMALGDRHGRVTIERSAESDMSSILPQAELLRGISPSSEIVERIEVEMRRLDEVELGEFAAAHLKIDVQGLEPRVLDGSREILDRVRSIQLEMALVPIYEGETGWRSMVDLLDRLGFDLHLVIPGYFERKLGRELQFDGVFVRRDGGQARTAQLQSPPVN